MVENPSDASSCARNMTRTVRCQLDFTRHASKSAWYSHRRLVRPPSRGTPRRPTLPTRGSGQLACTVLSDAEILARCPLLAGLPDGDLVALADAAQRRRFAAGEHLFLTGDPSRGLMVSAAGRV